MHACSDIGIMFPLDLSIDPSRSLTHLQFANPHCMCAIVCSLVLVILFLYRLELFGGTLVYLV